MCIRDRNYRHCSTHTHTHEQGRAARAPAHLGRLQSALQPSTTVILHADDICERRWWAPLRLLAGGLTHDTCQHIVAQGSNGPPGRCEALAVGGLRRVDTEDCVLVILTDTRRGPVDGEVVSEDSINEAVRQLTLQNRQPAGHEVTRRQRSRQPQRATLSRSPHATRHE